MRSTVSGRKKAARSQTKKRTSDNERKRLDGLESVLRELSNHFEETVKHQAAQLKEKNGQIWKPLHKVG